MKISVLTILSIQIPVSNYLKRLERSNFDAFDPSLQRRDGWLPLEMWWKNLKGTF